MNKQFALDYELEKTIYDSYHKAQDAGDEAGMEKFRAMYREEFAPYLNSQEADYINLYQLYKSARERGNEYIDLNEPYQYRDADTLLAALRKYGIERFTFSSGWSSAIETSWELTQKGCTLEGMTEINGTTTKIFSDEYERVPAFIFKTN